MFSRSYTSIGRFLKKLLSELDVVRPPLLADLGHAVQLRLRCGTKLLFAQLQVLRSLGQRRFQTVKRSLGPNFVELVELVKAGNVIV